LINDEPEEKQIGEPKIRKFSVIALIFVANANAMSCLLRFALRHPCLEKETKLVEATAMELAIWEAETR
jgi:hypothetical protein